MNAEPPSTQAEKPTLVLPRGGAVEYAAVACAIGAMTGLGLLLPRDAYESVGLVYLLAIVILSLKVGRGPVLAAGLLSAVCWEYFFIPPRFTFRIGSPGDGLMFGTYFVVALVAGQYTARIREQAVEREILRKARAREKLLAESERLHRALLDSVSHELRTPLSVITAALEEFETAPAAEQAGRIDEARTAARRLNHLVENLLNQTRLESGALKLRMDWCDPRDLVNDAIESASDSIAGHPLEVNVAEELPPVRADFALTERALANLVLNAAVHTPAGAAITVSAGIEPDGGRFFVSVADRGPGLSKEIRSVLFRKFARDRRGATGGLGLGLSIVRGFVAAQGGEVSAADNAGGGAVFTIYLPQPPRQAGGQA